MHILVIDALSAYATGAGNIYLSLPWLDSVESDDELVALLSHEFGHISLHYHQLGGAVHLQKQALNMRDVPESALHAVRGPFDEKSLAASSKLTAGTYQVVGDATRLKQVLTNLLANAAKYTDAGGRVDITLSTETSGNGFWALLEVKDTGAGIPAEKLSALFDLFVQVDANIDRARAGLGIDLTLVRKLVEMHGGSVSAYSHGPGAPESLVLVIEDTVDARETLKSLLEAYGCAVEVAATGEEGLQRLLSLRPDIAIVDIGMPGLDGYEFARRAREGPRPGQRSWSR